MVTFQKENGYHKEAILPKCTVDPRVRSVEGADSVTHLFKFIYFKKRKAVEEKSYVILRK